MSPQRSTRLYGLAFALALALGLLTVACGSIDERRGGTDEVSPYRLQSLDESCGASPSLTGASLLDQIDTSYTDPVDLEGERETSTLRIDIAYDGGRRTCYPWDRAEPPHTPRLELGVDLQLTTAGGEIDLTVPGTVSVLADSDQVRFSGSVPYASRDGDIDATPDADPDRTEIFVEGWLATDSDASQGALRLITPGEYDSLEHRTVAAWNIGERRSGRPAH